MRQIDMKHHVEGDRIIKTTNGQEIPENEPTILFRGRDHLALPMLTYYRQLCIDDGCTDMQTAAWVKWARLRDWRSSQQEIQRAYDAAQDATWSSGQMPGRFEWLIKEGWVEDEI
jgi:hypothetical protein